MIVGKKLIVWLTKWINHDDDDGLHWLLILSKVKHRYYSINTFWWHTYTLTHMHLVLWWKETQPPPMLPLLFVVVIVVAAANKYTYGIVKSCSLSGLIIMHHFSRHYNPFFPNMILSYYHQRDIETLIQCSTPKDQSCIQINTNWVQCFAWTPFYPELAGCTFHLFSYLNCNR